MKTVLIFKNALLPISETFILSQVSALSTFNAKYAGLRRARLSLPLPADVITLFHFKNRYIAQCFVYLYRLAIYAPRFYNAIAALKPDIVHAHFADSGACAMRVSFRLDVPLVVTLHGYDITVKSNFRKRYAFLWKNACRFLCVSEFIKRKALASGFPADKLQVHYIGIDCDKFVPSLQRESGLVLFIGRLVEKKGCAYLLRAMKEVQQVESDARLVVIGDGHLKSQLQTQAQKLGLNCTFLGSQDQAVVRKYLQKASVFCLPSITARNGDSEGLPIVILEALASGTPVVSTYHAGIPEAIFHEKTGLLSPERDHRHLARNILRFLQDSTLALACSKRGVIEVKLKFDLKKQTAILEEIYEDIILKR